MKFIKDLMDKFTFLNNKQPSLDKYLKKFIGKELSKDNAQNITNRIVNLYVELDYITKNLMIIDSLATSIDLEQKLNQTLIDTHNDLIMIKKDYDFHEEILDRFSIHQENNIDYLEKVQENYSKFIKNLKKLSYFNDIIDTIDSTKSNNEFFKAYKNKDSKKIKYIENILYEKLLLLDGKNRTIKDKSVLCYSSNIPTTDEYYYNNKEYERDSRRYKIDQLENILNKLMNNIFTEGDYNKLLDLFKDVEIKNNNEVNDYKMIHKIYNIDNKEKSDIYINYTNLFKELISLETQKEDLLDKIGFTKHNINQYLSLNEWYSSLNKYVIENNSIVENNIKKNKMKIVSSFSFFDSFYKRERKESSIHTALEKEKIEVISKKEEPSKLLTIVKTLNIENYTKTSIDNSFKNTSNYDKNGNTKEILNNNVIDFHA